MNIFKLPKFIFLALLIAGCTSDPKSDEAKVTEAKAVQQVEYATAYEIMADSSKVAWVGTKPTGRHNGFFPISDGALNVSNGEIVGGKITIDLANLDVEDDDLSAEDKKKLTSHLKSSDFFDVERYPTAKFVITDIAPFTEDKKVRSQIADTDSTTLEEENEKSEFMLANPSHTVTGNLTIRDNTKSITFPANIVSGDGQITAKARFNIDRTDWEVSYGDESEVTDKARDTFIYNKVNIGFDIIAVK